MCVKTICHRDAFGNKDSLTTSNCAGSVPARQQFATRTSSTSYSAATMPTVSINGSPITLVPGAFALTATNAEGHSESRLYDPRFGAATQLTGPNGLSTTWTLDDFGRKVRETQPDGTSVVTAYCFLAAKVADLSSNSPDCPTPPAAEVPADAVSFTHSEPRDTANANKSDVGVYGYGPAGPGAVRPHALQSVTDAAGATTSYSHDANGNLTAANAGKYRSITYTSR